MKRTISYYHRRAVEILQQIHYATLATVNDNGQPWNSPVAATYDERGRIYWVSDKQGQHSRNVRHTGEVFIVIYDSTVPEGQGEGLYIQAKAYQLEDPEEIRRVRCTKKGPQGDDPARFMGDGVRRVYMAVPQRAWMNDAQIENGVFIRDYRVELLLTEIKKRLKRVSA